MFHVATNVNSRTVTKPGPSSRNAILRKMWNSPAPSIRAASISSDGTDASA